MCVNLKNYTAWELWVKFYLGQNADYNPERAPQRALRNCSKEAGGRSVYMLSFFAFCFFFEEGVHVISHIFFGGGVGRFLLVTMKDFSAFIDVSINKNWVHKISSWKYLTVWKPVLPVFPDHRVPHFCSWCLKISSCSNSWCNPCRWQVPIYNWQGPLLVINYTIICEAFHDHFVPQC